MCKPQTMRVSHGLLLLPLYTRLEKMHIENSRIRIISVLNLAGIKFPMSQIKKFETLNDISINIYTE